MMDWDIDYTRWMMDYGDNADPTWYIIPEMLKTQAVLFIGLLVVVMC